MIYSLIVIIPSSSSYKNNYFAKTNLLFVSVLKSYCPRTRLLGWHRKQEKGLGTFSDQGTVPIVSQTPTIRLSFYHRFLLLYQQRRLSRDLSLCHPGVTDPKSHYH